MTYRINCVGCGVLVETARKNRQTCAAKECIRAYARAYQAKLSEDRAARSAARRDAAREARKRTCLHCSAPFIPKTSDRITYCSRECAFAAKRAQSDARAAEALAMRPRVECVICGKTWEAARRNARHCSDACRQEQARRDRRAYYDATRRSPPMLIRCRGCASEFTSKHGRQTAFCSNECAKRYRRRVAGNTHRRRARRLGVAYESVNVLHVFERDGWRCQICGRKTPKSRRGTLHPNAPELDHRIPLARGGGHTYDNVQCACRRCNGNKGAKSEIGQIPLGLNVGVGVGRGTRIT